MRASYQILVFPYIKTMNGIEYAILKRRDANYWQGVAGGGEDGETIIDSAKRETWEETGISKESTYIKLDTITSQSVEAVVGCFLWGEDIYVINEYCFGVEVKDKQISLSAEHTEYKWVFYNEAVSLLKWDNNRTALWELNKRLTINNG